ncbi:MAG TPA: SBBP repeat-containing protein, partial [Saprospiraceae bacterium]|nr:SBBP repeat-containing protein [Saprospiraceae bacterium]
MVKVLFTIILFATNLFFSNGQGAELVWAKHMGGTGNDYGYSIAVDDHGNVYTVGKFRNTSDFDPGSGIYNLTSFGNNDIFVSKLDSLGNFIWAKQVGGTGNDGVSHSITFDESGNVYIIGDFEGTCDLDPGSGTYNLTSLGGRDIFILKLDAMGNFVWAKQMGGPINEIGFSIDVDGSGNVYTTGQFENTSDFDPGLGTYYLTSFGGVDIFISKLDASGNFIWAKQIGGGPNHQYGYSIGVDSSENVYITGSLYGTSDFDPGSGTYNLTSFGTGDIFVSKLDASGNFLWAKQMGGINVENGNSIAIDGSGNVYTTGKFNSTSDFDPGPGTYYLTSFGDSDIYISLLDALGNFIWAKNMGGTSIDEGLSIEVDVNGYVYTIGYFVGTCDFDPGSGTYNLTSFGNNDIFILKLDASGNFVWAKQMGGTGYDVGRSIAVDDDWNVYTTGSFSDIGDFDPSSGIYNLTSIGNYDIYVSKLGQQPTNTYSYTNGLGFGTDINGNNWNIWSANGSNIWDWQSNYVNGYLHYSFKVFNYSGFYCSGSCRYHNIWSKNPNLGFELSDVMAHDISVFPENNQNNHIYQVNIQWNANGYNALVYDITSGTQYSDNDYTHPVNSNTYDSWTWGYSVWSNGTGYNDGEPNLHASQWTGNVYQDGPTGTIGGGGDIRTNALPVMQFGISSMPQNAIKLNGMQKLIADPIQLGTGTYTYSHLDFKIPSINGPLKFERFYNSLNSNLSETLGYGWSHSYNFRLINRQTAWDIQYPDGHLATFIPMNNSGQSFPIFSGTTDSLQKNANNSY